MIPHPRMFHADPVREDALGAITVESLVDLFESGPAHGSEHEAWTSWIIDRLTAGDDRGAYECASMDVLSWLLSVANAPASRCTCGDVANLMLAHGRWTCGHPACAVFGHQRREEVLGPVSTDSFEREDFDPRGWEPFGPPAA